MKPNLEMQKKMASEWFRFIQSNIIEEFQNLEKEFSKKKGTKTKYFKKNRLY